MVARVSGLSGANPDVLVSGRLKPNDIPGPALTHLRH